MRLFLLDYAALIVDVRACRTVHAIPSTATYSGDHMYSPGVNAQKNFHIGRTLPDAFEIAAYSSVKLNGKVLLLLFGSMHDVTT